MVRSVIVAAGVLLLASGARVQTGPTQSRDGLGDGSRSQITAPSNSLPAGSVNAQTGPQSQPAYSSGLSTTANPGEAFVRNTPVPATGPALSSPGTLSTTTIAGDGTTTTRSGGPGVGEAARPPR